MKFLADCMLGKLAKWLRLIGLDTTYIHDANDAELVRIALREDRILLTRDNELAGRRMVRDRSLFIETEEAGTQLTQVIDHFKLEVRPESMFSRCIVCNQPIEAVSKESIKEIVPPYVFETQEEFGRCPSCSKIYWRGTHVDHVMESLAWAVEDEV